MIKNNSLRSLVLAFALASLIPACAAYKKCGMSGCPGDAQITAQVQALFKQHSELEIPSAIGVQTLDGVVYLTGLVDTDFERRIALSIALGAPGVTRVVNSLELRNGGAVR